MHGGKFESLIAFYYVCQYENCNLAAAQRDLTSALSAGIDPLPILHELAHTVGTGEIITTQKINLNGNTFQF